jgi:hypothetical protein
MKSLLRMSSLVMVVVLLGASSAFADGLVSVGFTDQHNYWLHGEAPAGVNWSSGVTTFGINRDAVDVIGQPNYTNGSVTFWNDLTGSKLSSIVVNYTNTSTVEKPGDLFLDVNGDKYWDYVVRVYDGTPNPNAGAKNIYGINVDMTKAGIGSYLLSGTSDSGQWAGLAIRDNHPFAIDPSTVSLGPSLGTVNFSGWNSGVGNHSSSFSFNLNTLPYFDGTSPLTLAWGTDCANDVLFEHIAVPPPVPEPSTLLLLGGGLLGLVGWSRARRNQKTAVSVESK